MMNIRKGDLVQVISGPSQDRGGDRGKQGRVIEVQHDKNRVIVEGINFVTKHLRVGQTQRGTKTGGIETHESPIHVSNVALVNPDTKLPARVGFKVEVDDKGKTVRVRYFKESRREGARAKRAAAKPASKDAAAKSPAAKKPTAAKPAAKATAKSSAKAAASKEASDD